MSRRAFSTHPLVLRQVQVRRIAEVSGRMRRITVGGEQLGRFVRDGAEQAAFVAPGFDDHVKLIFASDGDLAAALPVQLAHGIEWLPSTNRLTRDYTPRRVDAGEIDLDFVLHGDGPAAGWAQSVAIGDDLWFVGPKSSSRLPDDVEWVALIGDETALPAIGRFLDDRPLLAPVSIVVVVEDEDARQSLTVRDGDSIEWITGDPSDPAVLERAVRSLDLASRTAQSGYVWAAGESAALLPVRKHLTRDVGMPKSRMSVTGYWHVEREPIRSGVGDEVAATTAADASVRPIDDPLPWFVVRAAVRLGIVDAVARGGPVSAATIANRCGVDPHLIAVLVPILLQHGVLTASGDSFGPGPLGDEIIDDEHVRERFVGLDADTILALDALPFTAPAGMPAWLGQFGSTVSTAADADAALYAELIDGAQQLGFLLDGLLADERWTSWTRCVLTGPGTAHLVAGLTQSRRLHTLDVVESEGALTALRDEVEEVDEERVAWTGWDQRPDGAPADLAVAAYALGHRTDNEASVVLADLRGRASELLLIEPTRPDGLGPGAERSRLRHYALTGSLIRDTPALSRLAERAGWHVADVIELGWGVVALRFTAAEGT